MTRGYFGHLGHFGHFGHLEFFGHFGHYGHFGHFGCFPKKDTRGVAHYPCVRAFFHHCGFHALVG